MWPFSKKKQDSIEDRLEVLVLDGRPHVFFWQFPSKNAPRNARHIGALMVYLSAEAGVRRKDKIVQIAVFPPVGQANDKLMKLLANNITNVNVLDNVELSPVVLEKTGFGKGDLAKYNTHGPVIMKPNGGAPSILSTITLLKDSGFLLPPSNAVLSLLVGIFQRGDEFNVEKMKKTLAEMLPPRPSKEEMDEIEIDAMLGL